MLPVLFVIFNIIYWSIVFSRRFSPSSFADGVGTLT
jgi:hypothetical protein